MDKNLGNGRVLMVSNYLVKNSLNDPMVNSEGQSIGTPLTLRGYPTLLLCSGFTLGTPVYPLVPLIGRGTTPSMK